MRDIPERAKYLRNPEEYSTAELSMYALETIIRTCEDRSYSTKLTTAWENSEEWVSLHSRDLDVEFPTFQMNVRSKTSAIPQENIYMFKADYPLVSMYSVDPRTLQHKTVEHLNPNELTVICMGYLRRQSFANVAGEPLNSKQTEQQFKAIMANLAIDSAIEQGSIDMPALIASYVANKPQLQPSTGIETAKQGVFSGGNPFPYSRSERQILMALNQRAQHEAQLQAMNQITHSEIQESDSQD